jgi:hypothetical protein
LHFRESSGALTHRSKRPKYRSIVAIRSFRFPSILWVL